MFYSDKLDDNVLIKIENLVKKYKGKNFIDIKNLEINKNNRIALFGTSKSGKTILCEIIAGLRKYNSGKILRKNKMHINLQMNETDYSKITSCYDYIKLYLDSYHIDLKSDAIYSYLKELDLWNVAKLPISNLTFTQKQKTNILLAVITNPDLIILDNVTNNLDNVTKEVIFNFLNNYYNSNDSSYVIVTNNFEDIEHMTDVLWILYNGRIIENTEIEVIINKYGSVKNFINTQFTEYKEFEQAKIFSWKEEIDKDWSRRWDNENKKRKARNSKYQ